MEFRKDPAAATGHDQASTADPFTARTPTDAATLGLRADQAVLARALGLEQVLVGFVEHVAEFLLASDFAHRIAAAERDVGAVPVDLHHRKLLGNLLGPMLEIAFPEIGRDDRTGRR